ncbi:MAG: hypothetical protein HY370_09275 [Proteobacteria bacterium]|nr:hypothetical protein [Pseudomonadota bacterium]
MTESRMTKAQNPFEDSVLTEMAADIAVNGKGQIMVMHQKPFAFPVRNIEYHAGSGHIVFVGDSGEEQDFGMTAPENIRGKLEKVREAALCLIDREEEKIAGFKLVPFTVRGTNAGKTVH